MPTETEKIVTAKDDVPETGFDVGDGVSVDAGDGLMAVAAGCVGTVERVDAGVVAGDTVRGVQLKMAVKIKKDRTNIVKALPNISLLIFIKK